MKEKQTTWQDYNIEPKPPLQEFLECEVLVIGSGITGIATAYQLARAGKRVCVLEKKTLQESVTADTTAFLTYSLDTSSADLERIWGRGRAKEVIRSHKDAIEYVEKKVQELSIACEFNRVANYLFANSKEQFKSLEEDAAAFERMGFPVMLHRTNPLPFPTYGVLEIPNQAKFHPLAYCAALREQAEKSGAKFYERTEVRSLKGEKAITAKTAIGTIVADSVVIATYNPMVQPWWYKFKKGMYVSYVYEASIPKGLLPEALYEDTENPYHYFRVDAGAARDRMIIGGEDHREELPISPKRSFKALDEFIVKRLGSIDYKIERSWIGPILEPSDGLALIGRLSRQQQNRYVATAFSGNGMTYAHIAAELISDLIQGKQNPLERVYDPGRSLSAKGLLIKGGDYTEEFFNGAVKNFLK